MTVDLLAALITIVGADATVTQLAGAHVYGGDLPSPTDFGLDSPMPFAAVVLAPAGGGLLGNAYQQYGDVRVDSHCYGATLHEAWTLHLAVRAVLKAIDRQVSDQVLVHWARILSDGALARDPVKEWPTCLASYQVLSAEVAAA